MIEGAVYGRYYQALPVRDDDRAPDGATAAVFADGGSLAGFIGPDSKPGTWRGWRADGWQCARDVTETGALWVVGCADLNGYCLS